MKDNKQQNSLVPELRFAEFVGDGEWEEDILGNRGMFNGGGTPSKSNESFWQGDFPWISSSDISNNSIHHISITRFITTEAIKKSATKVIAKNSLLIVSRVGVGKLAISKNEICTSQDFTNFTPNKDDLVFLGYHLKSKNDLLLSFSQGMAIKGFTKDDIFGLPLPFPKSLKEQQKIATTLSSLDDLLQAETERLALLKEHKKGLLQQLFPKQGEKVPQLRFVEFVGDGVWEEKALSNLITNISPPKKLKSSQFQEKGKYPIIDQSQKEIAGWSNDEKAIVKNKFPLIIFGDHTCILKIAEKPFIQGADGIKIFKGSTLVETRYLYYALQSNPIVMKEYKRHYSILKEKIFSYPNIDSGEQQKIANTLSSVDELIETQSEKIATLKAHKKGLLQGMFPEINTL